MTYEEDEMQWAAESFSDTAKELLESDCSVARTVELGAKLEKNYA